MVRYSLFLLFFTISTLATANSIQIEHLQDGTQSYRRLFLKNGLQVLLISDSDATKSAAALSVKVGSMSDPKNMIGLAHFVEHLLFIKTNKFPKVGGYTQFVGKNGGSANAYTALDHTNYYFQVGSSFDETLNRFAQFFISPIFDPKFVKKEKQAVHNEYSRKVDDDGRVFWHTLRELLPINAPARTMGTGNNETLKNVTAQDAQNFFNTYYIAKNMSLSITGTQSLDELQAKAQTYFSAIRSGKTSHQYSKTFFHTVDARDINIKSVENSNELDLFFEVPDIAGVEETQVARVIKSLVSYEGPKSFASELLKQGLVTYSNGWNSSRRNGRQIGFTCNLTKKGRASIPKITAMFFSYINSLKDAGYRKYIFNEISNNDRIKFNYRTRVHNSALAKKFTRLMVDEHPFEFMNSNIQKYSQNEFGRIMSYIVPTNLDRILFAPDVTTDQVGHGYKTHYSVTAIDPLEIKKLKQIKTYNFKYPEKNPFTLTKNQLDKKLPINARHLTKVKIGNLGDMWIHNDQRFLSPKASIRLLIYSDRFGSNAQDYAHTVLYDYVINESMREWLYSVRKSAIDVEVTALSHGLYIRVEGFAPHMTTVIKELSTRLQNFNISDIQFDALKNNLIKNLNDRKLQKPRNEVTRQFNTMLYSHYFHHDTYLKFIDGITKSNLKSFAKSAFDNVKIQGVMVGAIEKYDILKSYKRFFRNLKSKTIYSTEFKKPFYFDLPKGKFAFQKSGQKKMQFWETRIYAKDKSSKSAAAVELFERLFSRAYYTELRTVQQLAYSLNLYGSFYRKRPRLNLYIESSTHSPEILEDRANTWLQKTITNLSNLEASTFQKAKATLIKSLLEPSDSYTDAAGDLYYQLVTLDGDGNYERNVVRSLKSMSLKSFITTIKSVINDGTYLTGYVTKKGAGPIQIPNTHREIDPSQLRQDILDDLNQETDIKGGK